MAVGIAAETVVLDLNTHNTQKLVLEPALNYDSIVQRSLNVVHLEFGKDKMRMLHLSRPGNMLQPRSSCDTWNPTIQMGLRGDEIRVSDYEVNGEQCPDEWDVACYRNLKGNDPEEFPNYGPELNALEQAMVRQIRLGLMDDIYKVAYFGDVTIRTRLADGEINLDHMSEKPRENFLKMMSVADGWWIEIMDRSYSRDPKQKVNYVDSNNGTVPGNATLPANITAYFRKLRNTSTQILRNWNRNRDRSLWPVYMVQGGLFEAYKLYLQGLGTEIANRFIIDGEEMTGMLLFENYVVAEIPEWDMYDYETGNWDEARGQSKIQRAIFTARENLTALTNVVDLEGHVGSGLVIQQSPVLKDKGKKYMYHAFGMGFGVAQPQLMTASWNSNRDSFPTS